MCLAQEWTPKPHPTSEDFLFLDEILNIFNTHRQYIYITVYVYGVRYTAIYVHKVYRMFDKKVWLRRGPDYNILSVCSQPGGMVTLYLKDATDK